MPEDRNEDRIRSLIRDLAQSAPAAPTFSEITQRSEPGRLRAVRDVAGAEGSNPVVELTPNAPEPELDYVTPTHRQGKPFRYMAAMVGFVLIAAGGVFAYGAMTGNDGAATPEAAVTAFVDSLVGADVAGVLELLPPNERVVLRESLESLKEQTDRLGLTDQLDLDHVSGLQLEAGGKDGSPSGPGTVSSLQLQSQPLGESVAAVTVEGTLHANADDGELPLGPVARDLLVDVLPEGGYQGLANNITRAINDNPVRLVTVKMDGGWHVSLWYTIAEYIRRSSDAALPEFGSNTIQPTGADSPETAVKALISAGQRYDFRAEVALATPDESKVLYDYLPTFLAGHDLHAEFGHARSDVKLTTEVEGDGERRTVVIQGWDTTVSYTEQYVDGPSGGQSTTREVRTTVHQAFDGECFTSEAMSEPPLPAQDSPQREKHCRSDLSSAERLIWDLTSTVRVVVQRVGDRWFVDPVRSVVGQSIHRLAQIPDAATLKRVLDSNASRYLLSVDSLNLVFGFLPFYYSVGNIVSESTSAAGPVASVESIAPAPATSRPAG